MVHDELKEKVKMKKNRIIIFFLAAAMILIYTGCSALPTKQNQRSDQELSVPTTAEPTDELTIQVPEQPAEPASEEIAQSAAEPGSEGTDPTQELPQIDPEPTAAPTEPESSGSDVLVVYFSRIGEQYNVGVIEEGNTAIAAKMIAEQTGADLYEIIPEIDYPYTHMGLLDIARQELNSNARPAIKDPLTDLSQYNMIFIGAPVWWGDWPMIMYTFFESYDFSGKNLIPFATHEGSGLSGFDRKLSAALPTANVLTGFAARGQDCQNNKPLVENNIRNWLSGLGY